MKAVVDTNVIAYYLLGTEPFADEARQFWKTIEHSLAPAHWQAEFTNVVWMAVRAGAFPVEEGHRRLDFASRLRIQSVPVGALWQSALTLSLESEVSAYDTLFVALAQRRRFPLVTFDKQLLKVFPNVAKRPGAVATT